MDACNHTMNRKYVCIHRKLGKKIIIGSQGPRESLGSLKIPNFAVQERKVHCLMRGPKRTPSEVYHTTLNIHGHVTASFYENVW